MNICHGYTCFFDPDGKFFFFFKATHTTLLCSPVLFVVLMCFSLSYEILTRNLGTLLKALGGGKHTCLIRFNLFLLLKGWNHILTLIPSSRPFDVVTTNRIQGPLTLYVFTLLFFLLFFSLYFYMRLGCIVLPSPVISLFFLKANSLF